MKKYFLDLRRFILKTCVPEFVWLRHKKIGKAMIPIRGQPFSFGTKYLLVNGDYELHEIKLLEGKIIEDDQIIEMGGVYRRSYGLCGIKLRSEWTNRVHRGRSESCRAF